MKPLQLMGSGTVPLRLLLIGFIAGFHHGVKGSVLPATLISAGKMIGMPLLCLSDSARYGLR